MKIKHFDIKAIKEHLKRDLNEKRYHHSIGTEEKAIELAKKFGADPEKAAIAGLLHDCAKRIPKDKLLKFIDDNKIIISEDTQKSPSVIHAYVSEWIAKNEYGIKDPEVLSAIRHHTIGSVDMSTLDKVVFIADKIETITRKEKQFDDIRSILHHSNNLDSTLEFIIGETIKYLVNKKSIIHPDTILSWNSLLETKGKKL